MAGGLAGMAGGLSMQNIAADAVASVQSFHAHGGGSVARTPIDRNGSVSGNLNSPLAGPSMRNGSISQQMSSYASGGTRSGNSSSSDKSGTGGNSGGGKHKRGASRSRPWKAPVYAGMYPCYFPCLR